MSLLWWNDIRMSFCIGMTKWPMNDTIWIEWGQNEKEKNLGHLPCFKNSSHSTLIQVIWSHSRMRKSSFQHHFNHSEVIQYQNDHRMRKKSFQNDYKWQGWRGMEGFKIFSIKNIRHSILIPVIPPPFHHSWVIPLILSMKSIHPPPSAEGGGWIELALLFGISSLNHSHHSWLIPSFLNHPSHSKREVFPPTTLCRGCWVDWIDAFIWKVIPESFSSLLSHPIIPESSLSF